MSLLVNIIPKQLLFVFTGRFLKIGRKGLWKGSALPAVKRRFGKANTPCPAGVTQAPQRSTEEGGEGPCFLPTGREAVH